MIALIIGAVVCGAAYLAVGYCCAKMVDSGGGWRWWLTLLLWPLAFLIIIYALAKWAASGVR